MKFESSVIAVSGAAGFIGAHLCRALLMKGCSVIGIDDLRSGTMNAIADCICHPNFKFFKHDVSAVDDLEMDGVSCFVHLASAKIPRYSSGWEVISGNQQCNAAVLAFCIERNIRLLFASTSDVYGKNPNPPFTESSNCVIGSPENKRWAYAVSKLFMEHALSAAGREFGLNYQIMRFFGCYGPGMAHGWWGGPQSVFIEQAINKLPFEIHGDGLQTRSYVYISDLIQAVLLLIDKPELPPHVWNICADAESAISVIDLARYIQQAVNGEVEPVFQFIPYSQFGNYEDVRHRSGNANKALNLLGWKATTSLRDGLHKTISAMNVKTRD
jgi:UDP-glucose 4-epimerase